MSEVKIIAWVAIQGAKAHGYQPSLAEQIAGLLPSARAGACCPASGYARYLASAAYRTSLAGEGA